MSNNPLDNGTNFGDSNFWSTPNYGDFLQKQIDIVRNTPGVPLPGNPETEKTKQVARLIILLNKIEKELTTVKETLTKLKAHSLKYKTNQKFLPQIETRLSTVDTLLEKIRKARLNLNFYFI